MTFYEGFREKADGATVRVPQSYRDAAESLRRPHHNVTTVGCFAAALSAKR